MEREQRARRFSFFVKLSITQAALALLIFRSNGGQTLADESDDPRIGWKDLGENECIRERGQKVPRELEDLRSPSGQALYHTVWQKTEVITQALASRCNHNPPNPGFPESVCCGKHPSWPTMRGIISLGKKYSESHAFADSIDWNNTKYLKCLSGANDNSAAH